MNNLEKRFKKLITNQFHNKNKTFILDYKDKAKENSKKRRGKLNPEIWRIK